MLLFGLNTSVGLFLEFSAFSVEVTVISFNVEVPSGSIIEWLIFFSLFRTIFVRVSGGDLFATFASVIIAVPFNVQGTVALKTSNLSTWGDLWVWRSEGSNG